jgi:DNA invertase Pin-like site-specific DNA recombinase
MGRKVIELIRVSTDQQAGDDRASIPAQRAINRRTAQAYGLEIIRTIEITDVSGAAVLHAPEMQLLLRLISSPEIHGVVAREFSRLMRPEHFSDFALLQAFADTNTVLYLPEGPIDFSSKMGKLMGGMRALIAGLERQEILERIWQAKEEKRRAGKFPQAPICLPYGVGYSEKRGWYYEPEAERVREAFRLFLAGEHSYSGVGKKVGIDPFNLRIILRNPIYMGWRVIDKRRDMRPSARRVKADGRQGDRPKILRAPDEVIRLKVIENPLVSEEDFQKVQQIMDAKKLRHWRLNSDRVPKFTYNGFLTCAGCGQPIYTSQTRTRFYYVCKSKKSGRASECGTSWMFRDRLESKLDQIFTMRLNDPGFLAEMAAEYVRRCIARKERARIARLQAETTKLRERRRRVLDAFFDGTIGLEERDQRLAEIDHALTIAQDMLTRETSQPDINPDALKLVVQPFMGWEFLRRDDKRRILSATAADIHVADYMVHGLYLSSAALGSSNEITRRDRGSWRRRA